MKAPLSQLFSYLAAVGLLSSGCRAHPTLMATPGAIKCFILEAPMDTMMKIDYNTTGLTFDTSDPFYIPAYITVSVKPSNRVFETHHHEAPVRSHLRDTNEKLEGPTGRIKHKFEVDGEATICFRTNPLKKDRRANKSEKERNQPFLFSYNVRFDDGMGRDSSDEAVGSKGNGEGATKDGNKAADGSKADIDSHLSHMEKELQRIKRGMQTILREADFAKEREALFHKQTESMHSATMFWPIVQVCVLLMTGFTQASHIVQFFKHRRII